jgi:calmodulin
MATATTNQRLADEEAARKARIRMAFDMFDKEKKGCVIQECAEYQYVLWRLGENELTSRMPNREVSTIMRYLGAYPSEKDIIKKILPEMQEDEPSTFVAYDRFEKKMLEVMFANEYAPDTDETLLAAFRVIDSEKKGYIDADTMHDLLVTKGTPFRDKEIEGTVRLKARLL